MEKSGDLPVEMGGKTLWEVVTTRYGFYSTGSSEPLNIFGVSEECESNAIKILLRNKYYMYCGGRIRGWGIT